MSLQHLLDPSQPFIFAEIVTALAPYWGAALKPSSVEHLSTALAPSSPFLERISETLRARSRRPSQDGPRQDRLMDLIVLTHAVGTTIDLEPEHLRAMGAIQEIEARFADPLDALVLESKRWHADWQAATTLACICAEGAGLQFVLRFLEKIRGDLSGTARQPTINALARFVGTDAGLHPLAHLSPASGLFAFEMAMRATGAMGLWRAASAATESGHAYQSSFASYAEGASRALRTGPKGIAIGSGRLEAARVSVPRLRYIARSPRSILSYALFEARPDSTNAHLLHELRDKPTSFLLAVEAEIKRPLTPEELARLIERGAGCPGFPLAEWRGAIGRHLAKPQLSAN